MLIYCVKDKKKTETINPKEVITKNGKKMIQGICSVCGSKKSQFIK